MNAQVKRVISSSIETANVVVEQKGESDHRAADAETLGHVLDGVIDLTATAGNPGLIIEDELLVEAVAVGDHGGKDQQSDRLGDVVPGSLWHGASGVARDGVRVKS